MSDVSITDLIAKARDRAKLSEYYRDGNAGLFVALADALDSATAPTKPPVHNHGPAEGRGLGCNESVVGGFLQGACMRVTEQTDPFSQSPHMAAKYWGELVKARKRIAELEAAVTAPTEPEYETLTILNGRGKIASRRRRIKAIPAGEWEDI